MNLEEGMAELYKQLDDFAIKKATQANTTCKKGCSSCCYLLALCGPADALRIADHILSKDDWKEWLPKLREAAGKAAFEGINKKTYFEKVIPCVFLDVQQGTCKVYEKRPACCRFHWVLTDPKDCAPTAPKDTKTAALNFLGLEAEVFNIDLQILPQLGWEVPPVAPIPLAVLWMMEVLTRDDRSRYNEVLKHCDGIPDPFVWSHSYAEGLMEEGSGVSFESSMDAFIRANKSNGST